MTSTSFDFGDFGENLASLMQGAGTPTTSHVRECDCPGTSANLLDCGHRICESCQHLAFISRQPEDKLIPFYSDLSNFYGKAEATPVNIFSPAKTCPFDCMAAPLISSIPCTPRCPPYVKKLLVWSWVQDRIERDRLDTGPVSEVGPSRGMQNDIGGADKRPLLYAWHAPERSFEVSADESGVKPIGQTNTVYMYPRDAINWGNVLGSDVPGKIMHLRIRPVNEDHSKNAVYIWVGKAQKVGELVEKLCYILCGLATDGLRVTHYSFLSMNGAAVVGWDRPLEEVFRHNMTVHTELGW